MPNIPRIYLMTRKIATLKFYNQLIIHLQLNSQVNQYTQQKYQIQQKILSAQNKLYDILKWQEENIEHKTQKQAIEEVKYQLKNIVPEKQVYSFVQNIMSLNYEKFQNKQAAQQKVSSLISDMITCQSLTFQNPECQRQFLQQKRKQQQLIKSVQKKQNFLLKNIQNIQNQIYLNKNDQNLQKISQKVKQKKQQFEKNKMQLKQKCHSVVQNNMEQKQSFIRCQNFDENLFKQKIKKMSNKMIKIELEKNQSKRLINGVRGGNGNFQYKVNYVISQDQLKKSMKKFSESIGLIMNASQKVGAVEQLKNALQAHKLKLSLLDRQFSRTKIENENKLGQTHRRNDVSFRMDVVIVIDTTASMGQMIQSVKKKIIQILSTIKKQYKQAKIQFGIIGYKDHPNTKPNLQFPEIVQSFKQYPLLETFQLSSDFQRAMQFIERLKAEGEGDVAEAAFDGLMAVNSFKFHPNSFRTVIWIADAPPHGKQFGEPHDNYEQGCPCGIKLDRIVNYYKQNKIHLNFNAQKKPLLSVKNIFQRQDNFGKLFSYGQITKDNFLKIISQDLLNEMNKKMAQKHKQISKQFNDICDKVIQKVQKDVEQLVKQVQALRQKSELNIQLDILKNEIQKIQIMKQTLYNLKDISQQEKKLEQLSKLSGELQQTIRVKSRIQDKKKGIYEKIIYIQRQNNKENRFSRQLLKSNLEYFYSDISEQNIQFIIKRILQ